MDEALLTDWKNNPRTFNQWSEAFLACRCCVKSLPLDPDAQVTYKMIAAKREFHCQAQDVRTPSKVLFSDMDTESDGFEDVTSVPLLSPFKPSVDASSPGLVGREKKMAKYL
jgi:hypothetical protein